MASYQFSKSGVTKPVALNAYLNDNFAQYQDLTYTDPDLTVNTTVILDSTQYADLLNLVNSYTDPAVFLLFDTKITDDSDSDATNSSTLTTVKKMLFSPFNPTGSAVFNTLKNVIEYSTSDIANFVTGSTTASVTFEIFDYTNNNLIVSNNIDITSILDEWQTLAQTGSGPQSVINIYTVDELRDVVNADDAIWLIKISVTNPNVNVQLHGLQKLFYQVY